MKSTYRITNSTFLMIAVGACAGLWAARSGVGLGNHVWAIALLLLFPWAVAPFKLRFGHTLAERPNFVAFDPGHADTSARIAARVRSVENVLEPLGFVAVKSYQLDNLLKNCTGFVTLFRNERTGEAAKLIGAKAQSQVVTIETNTLAFTSEFADGTEIITSNSRVPKLTPPYDPPVFVMVFPDSLDPATLYTIHRARVADRMPSSRQTDAIGDDPDSFLRRTEFRAHDHQILSGYYERLEDRQVLRPTWKGAVLMSCKLLWPVAPLRKAWRRLVARNELRRLGLILRGGRVSGSFVGLHDGMNSGQFLPDRPIS